MYDEDLDYGGRPLYVRRTPEEQLKREEEIANLKKLLEALLEKPTITTVIHKSTRPDFEKFKFYIYPIINRESDKYPALARLEAVYGVGKYRHKKLNELIVKAWNIYNAENLYIPEVEVPITTGEPYPRKKLIDFETFHDYIIDNINKLYKKNPDNFPYLRNLYYKKELNLAFDEKERIVRNLWNQYIREGNPIPGLEGSGRH